MKRTELFFSILLVPLDFAALLLAAWTAHRLRFLDVVEEIRPVLYGISPTEYMRSAAIVAMIWLFIFALAGLYQRRTTEAWVSEFRRIFFACSTGLVVVIIGVFLRRELFSSRFIILAAWALAILFVSFGRLSIRYIERFIFRLGFGAHRVVMVGSGNAADEVENRIRAHPELGYNVGARVDSSIDGLRVLNGLVRDDVMDEIIFVDPYADREIRHQFLEFAEKYHLPFRYAPDLLASPIATPEIDFNIGVPLVQVPETTLIGWGRVLKRFFDIIASFLALVILFPAYLLLSLAIILESGFPIFYESIRVARDKKFVLYKYRTMYFKYCVGAKYGGPAAQKQYDDLIKNKSARLGPVPKIKNDPRITKVGKWLRRFSLDELPQLWNVLKGEMSLVGPRPHLPREIADYDKHHHKVLAIKPGLTGLAQVSGRSDLDFDDEVRLDRYYIEHWSFWLDIRILIKTIPAVFRKREEL